MFSKSVQSKLLLLAVVSDFLMPYILKLFYPGYHHMTMLISGFGEGSSPVKRIFDGWSIVSGVLFCLAAPLFYAVFQQISKGLAALATACILAFGIGDCVITGLFSSDAGESNQWTKMIHDAASAAGFVGLLLMALLLAVLYGSSGERQLAWQYGLLFLLACGANFVYASPKLLLVDLPWRGLWQRISLLFLYLPLVVFAWRQLQDTGADQEQRGEYEYK